MVKRYWLFRGWDYGSGGGADDFFESFDCLDDAVNKVREMEFEWAHVLDALDQSIIWNEYRRGGFSGSK
jgi:hypothetical protein